MNGLIARIHDRGFFFIHPDAGGNDIFAHLSQLRGVAFADLVVGDRVQYDDAPNPRDGRPCAVF